MVRTFYQPVRSSRCLCWCTSIDSGFAMRVTVLNRWERASYGTSSCGVRKDVGYVHTYYIVQQLWTENSVSNRLCSVFTLTARLSQRELLKKQEALLSIAPALRYVMNERVKQSGSSPVPVAGRWESPERRAGSRGSCHIVSGLLVGSRGWRLERGSTVSFGVDCLKSIIW